MPFMVKGKMVSLTKRDFVGKGGEGSVYRKAETAYKIYEDQSRMIPLAKIKELAVIDDKRVVRPEDVVFKGNQPVGYTMRFVPDAFVACQLFPKSFRNRHALTNDMAIGLVRKMQEVLAHIHSKQVLVVDFNEMNLLISPKLDEVYFIDADSYQTRSYPATAIMPSVRDVHSPTFNEGTDWFSFAVVSFQMLIGIHPYKGRHSAVKGLSSRMRRNLSVFDPEVHTPKSCLPVGIIPGAFRDWYKAVFEKGTRCAPPTGLNRSIAVQVVAQAAQATDKLIIMELFKCKWPIRGVYYDSGVECIVGEKGVCIDRKQYVDVDNL